MKRNLLLVISATTLLATLTLSADPHTGQSQGKPNDRQQNQIPDKSPLAVFAQVLSQVKARSRIPVLLPSELPSPIATAKHAVVDTAEVNKYGLVLYYELGMGDAGFAASFSVDGKPKFNPRELPNVEPTNLAHGLHGFSRAVSCGVSCAPANLWWEEDGILYQVQLKIPSLSEQSQEEALVKVVNSAIVVGAR